MPWSSGANVVSTRMELQNPETLAPADREAIAAACVAGNSSVHATGSSPGFISEALPIVLASIQRRLDCLTIYEFADSASRNSPEMLFGMMGFGARPEAGPNPHILEHMRMSFSGTIMLLAKALGLPIERGYCGGGAGHRPPGCAYPGRHRAQGHRRGDAQHFRMRNGKPLIRFIANGMFRAMSTPPMASSGNFANRAGE